MELTDEELLQAQLRLDDPYEQKNRIDRLPIGAEVKDILNIYAFKDYPIQKVRCAVCNSRRHKYGFTVLLSTGELLLVGSSCGVEIAHASWAQFEQRLKGQLDRQYYLRLIERIQSTDASHFRAIRSLERPFDRLSSLHRRFQKTLPTPYQLFGQRFRAGQPVLEVRVLRESQVRELSSTNGNAAPKYVEDVVFRHRLQGIQFFYCSDPLAEFKTSIASVEAVLALSTNTSSLSVNHFRKRFASARTALKQLSMLIEAYNAITDFFAPSNLVGAAEWLNRSHLNDGKYWAEDGALWWDGGRSNDAGKMHWPAPHHKLDATSVGKFASALALPKAVSV